MKKAIFKERLLVASTTCLHFTREMVIQTLPEEFRYQVHPNSSYDGNPLEGDEEVYPEDALEGQPFLGPWTLDEVIDFLWRDGKIPEWIDISVVSEDGFFTYMQLLCCGRYTALEKFLYHKNTDHTPVSVKSPNLPHGWDYEKNPGQFDLYWENWKREGNPYYEAAFQASLSALE